MTQTISLENSVLGVVDAPTGDGERSLVLRKVGAVVDLGNPGLSPPFPQRDPDNEIFQSQKLISSSALTTYLVVEAWAMMFPPMGFLGSAWKDMVAPECKKG